MRTSIPSGTATKNTKMNETCEGKLWGTHKPSQEKKGDSFENTCVTVVLIGEEKGFSGKYVCYTVISIVIVWYLTGEIAFKCTQD